MASVKIQAFIITRKLNFKTPGTQNRRYGGNNNFLFQTISSPYK